MDSIASFTVETGGQKWRVMWILTNHQSAWWCNALQLPSEKMLWNPCIQLALNVPKGSPPGSLWLFWSWQLVDSRLGEPVKVKGYVCNRSVHICQLVVHASCQTAAVILANLHHIFAASAHTELSRVRQLCQPICFHWLVPTVATQMLQDHWSCSAYAISPAYLFFSLKVTCTDAGPVTAHTENWEQQSLCNGSETTCMH